MLPHFGKKKLITYVSLGYVSYRGSVMVKPREAPGPSESVRVCSPKF